MVGDPSGKTDMRRMMDNETIKKNVESFKKQMSNFLDFSSDKAIMVDNAAWLLNLNYIEFLRDVGVKFSVNKMLTAECFKSRMERGLNFLEFNYMLMQAYDFLVLYKKYGCVLELGGDDQWSNILAGADLIRRKEQGEAFGMTFKLLLTSDGKKMGKTEKGAVWLDPDKTSPYEFYQYWRNVDDADVENCLMLLTFLCVEDIKKMCAVSGEKINEAKETLAFEVTKQVHGEKAAIESREAARALFGSGANNENMPTTTISRDDFNKSNKLIDLMMVCSLTSSKGEGRRLIAGGGVSIDDKKIADEFYEVTNNDISSGSIIIKKGKKVYHKLVVEG